MEFVVIATTMTTTARGDLGSQFQALDD